jgi:hypothetical protein
MQELLCESLWEQLAKASKRSHRRYAAVAYLTTEKFVRFVEGDLVVVDASDEAIKSQKTSRALLKKLLRRGVRVHHLPKLHAKLIAFETSAFVGYKQQVGYNFFRFVSFALMRERDLVRYKPIGMTIVQSALD